MTPFFIDLHTHLRGTLTPGVVKELARKNNVQVPSKLFDLSSGGFVFSNFQEFLRTYDAIGAVVRTPEDLIRIAEDYLCRCAAEGTRYVEFMLSPVHSVENGISLSEQFDAVQQGIERAHNRSGVRASLIVTAVRHQGPTTALQLAEDVAAMQHPIVRGFGLTGNERAFHARDFAGAFYVARSAGLGCTAHVGEWGDAGSVVEAVNELTLDRVGHGLSVATDDQVIAELASRGTALEICLSSNERLGRTLIREHPLRRLFDGGCATTLATDDPAYFLTTPQREYEIAHRDLLFSDSELLTMSKNAIEAAFCSELIKDELHLKLKEALVA